MHSEIPARLAGAATGAVAAGIAHKICEEFGAIAEVAKGLSASLAGYVASTAVNTVMCDPAGAVATNAEAIHNIAQGTYQS
ncbi:MAG: hypothetical protein GDA48_24545 [Hormoscilla sp. GM102CHS1]|nr:hypothetical protein [Hormoscilla sp. GM102CHS1]